jgi:MarR family transcriptional regulator, 2-MHQ and catechol-resistance regulon repressor
MPSHYKGTESQIRALSAFINLVRATDSITDRSAKLIDDSGLTLGQFAVMEALYHLGPMCQHVLAQKLLRSGGNVTLVIDNLERAAMVKRVRNPKDRREVAVHLTAKGRKLITKVFPEHARVIEKMMSGLTAEEQTELRRIAAKLGKSAAAICVEHMKAEMKKETAHDSRETK